MRLHLRIIPLLFLILYPVLLSYGQSQTVAVDTTFEAYMENAWDEIRQSDIPDSLQAVYSEEFYQYYLSNSGSKTADKAVSQAFMMWGNIGAAEKADSAMLHFDYDSEIWHDFIPYVANAYGRSDKKTTKDYIELFEELRKKMTHPKSQSQVLWMLSSYYQKKDQIDELINIARQMIELNADKFFVDYGLELLYEIESLKVGQKAPKFNARTVHGDFISLSDYKNKIVLLEFWATWCSPCIPEIPHLKSIYSTYPESDLQIIGIALDRDTEKLKQFLREQEIAWPQIIQPEEWDDEIIKKYNVSGIPRTYIIGKDGKIIAKDLRGEELEKEIANLMNQ